MLGEIFFVLSQHLVQKHLLTINALSCLLFLYLNTDLFQKLFFF